MLNRRNYINSLHQVQINSNYSLIYLSDIIPYYAYPNNVQIKKLVATPDNDIIMPALK